MAEKQQQLEPAYFAVIPANVRYDARLSANAKLLYGEITALCHKEGFCWAGNQYFAELYGVKTIAVSRWISQLEKGGYITTFIDRKQNSRRHIKLVEIAEPLIKKDKNLLSKKIRTSYQKRQEGLIKKDKHNNTVNNTSNNTLPLTPSNSATRQATTTVFEREGKEIPVQPHAANGHGPPPPFADEQTFTLPERFVFKTCNLWNAAGNEPVPLSPVKWQHVRQVAAFVETQNAALLKSALFREFWYEHLGRTHNIAPTSISENWNGYTDYAAGVVGIRQEVAA